MQVVPVRHEVCLTAVAKMSWQRDKQGLVKVVAFDSMMSTLLGPAPCARYEEPCKLHAHHNGYLPHVSRQTAGLEGGQEGWQAHPLIYQRLNHFWKLLPHLFDGFCQDIGLLARGTLS